MITDNYIKMCEKAEEIQKLQPKGIWHLHYDPGHEKDYKLDDKDYLYISFYYLPEEECIAILKWDNDEDRPIIGGYGDNDEGAIWLPTQEQLQEIILKDLSKHIDKVLAEQEKQIGPKYIIRYEKPHLELLALYSMRMSENIIKREYTESIVELWLAFVMFVKYQK